MLSILLGVFIVVKDFTLVRTFHMLQEVSLVLSHLTILVGRSRTMMGLDALCAVDGLAVSPPRLPDGLCDVSP